VVLAVCLGTIAVIQALRLPERRFKSEPEMNPPPASQAVAPRTPAPGAQRQMMTEEFFEKNVVQLVELEHTRNLAAMESARRRLDDKFQSYAGRVPQFASDVNSLSMRYQVVKALVTDKVAHSDEMEQVAAGLFAKDVLSDSQLHADIEEMVAQFHRDLDTNRDLISAALGAGTALASVSDPTTTPSLELLARASREELDKSVGAHVEQMPVATLAALGEGVLAEEAVRKRVTDAITSHTVDSKDETAKSPASSSKGAAVAGAAVGVLAGAADFWLLQARSQAALTKDCREALDKMRDTLWADAHNGMEAHFAGLVELVKVGHEMALRKAYLGGAP
jgi:hypothetical protein